jgi:sulfonate transport system permease protein
MTASTSAYGMLWSATAVLSACAIIAYLAIGAVERAVLRRYASEQLAT